MQESGTNWLIKFSVHGILLLSFHVAAAQGLTGFYQLSPYFDSNVQESLVSPVSSGGLKVGGLFSRGIRGTRSNGNAALTAYLFLDGGVREESKLAANLESWLRVSHSPMIYSDFRLNHFTKGFLFQDRRYQWTEGMAGFGIFISPALNAQADILYRATLFEPSKTFRFTDQMIEVKAEYAVTGRLTVSAAGVLGRITYKDYRAFDLSSDGGLIPLNIDQEDESIKGMVHLRYGGTLIAGIQAAVQSVNSNSVTGEFDLASYRLYLSGRLGLRDFYHIVHQRVNKRYRYPGLAGRSGFRDPEERIQNRTYVQLERTATEKTTLYLQVSFLENETIFNQQYYDKVLVELGLYSNF